MPAPDDQNIPTDLPADLPQDPATSYDPAKTIRLPENAQQTTSLAFQTTLSPGRWTVSASQGEGKQTEEVQADLPAFELQEVIGKGGFGEVWQALQSSLGRVIAIKRLREDRFLESRDDPGSSRQMEITFRQEAFTTARLDHPNIVPIYDLGVDDEGRPMLAMKLVRGRPWDELLIADAELPPREFLDRHLPILIDTAQAVAFAHSRGIIHRDLKPSQVMVGDYGEVLLMDWGLSVIYDLERANSTEDRPIDARLGMTLESASNPCGTVAFMAPEQTEDTAKNIGPWTDVYLLGGTLYYLLTLRFPHGAPDVQGAFRQAMLGEVTPAQMRAPNREIPAELAELCSRALAPNRAERLESAEAFLQALRDFQSGASKRRESEAIVGTIERRLSAGLASYRDFGECENELARAIGLWGENRAARQLQDRVLQGHTELALRNGDLMLARVLAERLEHTPEAVALFANVEAAERRSRHHQTQRRVLIRATVVLCVVLAFLAVFAYRRAIMAQNEREKADISRQLAENALGQSRKKAAEAERERDLAHDSRRRAEDLMSFMLVDLREELEPLNRLDILDQVAMKSLDYFEDLPAEEFTPTAWQQRVLSLRQIGQVLLNQGKLSEADDAFKQAQDLMGQLIESDPENLSYKRDYATILGQVAHVRYMQGELDEALNLNRQAREMLNGLANDAETRRALAERLAQGVDFELDAGNLETATELQQNALEIQRGLTAENPDSTADRSRLAEYESQLSDIQERLGLLADAIETQEDALAIIEELSAQDPTNPNLLHSLAGAYSEYAGLLRQGGRMEEALDYSRKCLDVFEPLAKADTANLDWQHRLGVFDLQLAVFEEISGQITPARDRYQDAIDVLEALVARDPENMLWRFDLGRAHQFLADLLVNQRQGDEALLHANKAQGIYSSLVEAAPENAQYLRHLGASLNAKGLILEAAQKYDAAEDALRKSLEIRREMLENDPTNAVRHRDVAVGLTNLAATLKSEGRYDEAIEAYWESADVLKSLSDADTANYQLQFDVIATQMNIGTVLQEIGREEDALEAYDLATESCRQLVKDEPANQEFQRMLIMIYLTRGEALDAMERPEHALHYFNLAIELAESQLADDQSNLDAESNLASALADSASIQWRLENREEALATRKKALAHYLSLVEASPSNPYSVYGLLNTRSLQGYEEREVGDLDAAAESYRLGIAESLEALEQPGQAPLAAEEMLPELALGLAIVEAQRGNIDLAIAALKQAVDHGFDDAKYLESEELLAPVREGAPEEIKKLKEQIRESLQEPGEE
ncbi:protein kinase [bacterium]|nr:protein kinase [bacterium]